LDDLAHRAADHDAADLDRRSVRPHILHTAAHVGIEREPDRPAEDLAVARLRDGPLGDLEIARPGLPWRTALQQHATIRLWHGGGPPGGIVGHAPSPCNRGAPPLLCGP